MVVTLVGKALLLLFGRLDACGWLLVITQLTNHHGQLMGQEYNENLFSCPHTIHPALYVHGCQFVLVRLTQESRVSTALLFSSSHTKKIDRNPQFNFNAQIIFSLSFGAWSNYYIVFITYAIYGTWWKHLSHLL